MSGANLRAVAVGPSPTPEPPGRRKKVRLITLGGTIASSKSVDGLGVTPVLSADALVAGVPGVEGVAELSTLQFRQYPSGDLRVADVVELARVVETAAREVDGIVIAQGTDTLEESSYLLDLLLAIDTPVVITGAMRNADLPGQDGPANLAAAIRVASSEGARGIGPLVVFADEIHLPRYVQKTHTSHVAAFTSPQLGPIGWIAEDRVRIPVVPRERPRPVAVDRLRPTAVHVGLVRLALGAAELHRTHFSGFDGVVVEMFGGGHVPSWTVPSLEAMARDRPVVMCSRTGAGELYTGTYSAPGSELDLHGRGLVGAGALTGLKARLLLTLLLMSAADHAEITAAFQAASP